MKKATIKEIAEELGISASSVSRALSNYPHTSEETKKKVKAAADRLGYRHNALAAALRNSKSRTIGLIVPKISMSFQAAVITAIQNKVHEYGYTVIICQSNESPDLEKKLVELLYASRVEGLIVSSSIHTTDFSHFQETLKKEIPLVFYDRVPPIAFSGHKIKGADFDGAYRATSHLIEQGCKRIVHVNGILTCSLYQERLKGYKKALIDHNIDIDEDLIFSQELTWNNATELATKIFSSSLDPDGVFCSNDTTALAFIQFAKEHKINIPDNLKIMGYSNDNRARISNPTLSSVEQFASKMGEKAAELIMRLIENPNSSKKDFISETIPVKIVERESSGVMRGAEMLK